MDMIRNKLAVTSREEILQQPLSFAAECSLVSDVFTNVHFLVKDGEMCYQLDDENPAWRTFLRSVDNIRSANSICADEGLEIASFEDYLRTSLEEGILYTVKTPVHHAAN